MNQEEVREVQESIDTAKASGAMRVADLRSAIKLQATAPKIVIAVPMGDKDDPDLFLCPKCDRRHFGEVVCPYCKEPHNADVRMRRAGLACIEWQMCAQQLTHPLVCAMEMMTRKSVPSARARNEMTFEAMNVSKAKYIFYWDDDTLIPPRTLYDMHRMMEMHPEIAILSGVYTTREECNEPLVYKNQGDGAYWGFSVEVGVLEDIFAAGAGCMMARVEALEDVERILGGKLWDDEIDVRLLDANHGRTIWGHDVRFCRRMWETSETYGKPDGARKPWRVCLAGWLQCYHFDIDTQTVYTLPPDSPCFKNANTRSYWDHVWRTEGFGSPRHYPQLYDRIVALVPKRAKVVDLGCGIGILGERLVKQKGADYYGYDISQEAISMLKSRWLQGEVADAADFKLNHFPGRSTVLIATETIEHLDAPRLENMLKQAHKAKLAIFSTPDGTLPGTPRGEHVQEFTAASLRKTLKPYFQNVKIERIPRGDGQDILLAVATHGGKK